MPSDHALALQKREPWAKNRKLARSGFKDLEYLPRPRTGWNATLAAYAFSARRRIAGSADLNLWAVMQGVPGSARYQELGGNALVLWHGTTAGRAAKIREVGLFHKRGLWTTLEPSIAHVYTRGRALKHGAGSATVVLLLDKRETRPGIEYEQQGPSTWRFHSGLPPERIAYILWDDHIEFVADRKVREPKAWGAARFKKKEGQWVPRSLPPVRFDHQHTYSSIEDWLGLSIARILCRLGSAAAIEIFSSLYSTIDPWEALEHGAIFNALERWCKPPRQRRGFKQFLLREG